MEFEQEYSSNFAMAIMRYGDMVCGIRPMGCEIMEAVLEIGDSQVSKRIEHVGVPSGHTCWIIKTDKGIETNTIPVLSRALDITHVFFLLQVAVLRSK
jgi:hypothetical protein